MLREAINQALKDRGESVCWLGRELEKMGVCSRQTVNNWLNRDKDTNSAVLAGAMDVLGLTIARVVVVKSDDPLKPVATKGSEKLNKRTGKKAYPNEQ